MDVEFPKWPMKPTGETKRYYLDIVKLIAHTEGLTISLDELRSHFGVVNTKSPDYTKLGNALGALRNYGILSIYLGAGKKNIEGYKMTVLGTWWYNQVTGEHVRKYGNG